ncbi:MAG: ribbon-helix-helix domain-containing protein [Thermoplasmata archaeon]
MKKLKVSVSVDEDLLEWVQEEIEKKRFASVSHAINFALHRLKEDNKK